MLRQMDERCGEASAVSKLANIATQDRSAYNERFVPVRISEGEETTQVSAKEYFEFKKKGIVKANLLEMDQRIIYQNIEILLAVLAVGGQTLKNMEFQDAFQSLRVSSVPPTQWSTEFANTFDAKTNLQWVKEFYKQQNQQESHLERQQDEKATDWLSEFRQQGELQPTAEDWVKEFHHQHQATQFDAELGRTAQEMLQSLDLEDPKLASSRFVAYLRELASNQHHQGPITTLPTCPSDFQAWKGLYLQSIAHLGQDQEWLKMDKTWEHYEGTGYGYKDFARNEFGTYHFSLPRGANPYINAPDKRALLEEFSQRGLLKDQILVLEAMVQENALDGPTWARLAASQQANEADAQAIAAFLRATQLNPSDGQSWVALAASCTNESCIPDALNALHQMVIHDEGLAHLGAELGNTPDLPLYTKVIGEAAMQSTSEHLHLAASILYNIAGQHSAAVQMLQRIPPNSANWAITNRLGASFANSRQYEEALKCYDRILSQDIAAPSYPRVHYNRGISLLCMERYAEAAASFVRALECQLPVDIVEGVRQELLPSYQSIWETLSVTLDLWGKTDLVSLCKQKRLAGLKAALPSFSQ